MEATEHAVRVRRRYLGSRSAERLPIDVLSRIVANNPQQPSRVEELEGLSSASLNLAVPVAHLSWLALVGKVEHVELLLHL